MPTTEPTKDTSVSRGLNGNTIKIIACVAMFLDHMVKAFSIGGTPFLVCSKIIGRIAFPLFAFFLVEGFQHSKNRIQYLLRLLLFAVLAEVPFDLVLYRRFWFFGHQNTLWTMSLGLIFLMCLDYVAQKKDLHFALAALLSGGLIAGFSMLGHFLRFDYHINTPTAATICFALIYLLKDFPPRIFSLFWSCVGLNLFHFANPGAFLSLLPVRFYNGTRGRLHLKYAFYIFYPAHLLLLLLLRRFRI